MNHRSSFRYLLLASYVNPRLFIYDFKFAFFFFGVWKKYSAKVDESNEGKTAESMVVTETNVCVKLFLLAVEL